MNYKNIHLGSIDNFNVIIEIPKGSENKYEYDEELDAIKFNWAFKNGFCFPFDYGFIPETLAEDDDTTDVFVINDSHLFQGIVIECKAIGMIEVVDREKTDNKIVAVPLDDPIYGKYESLQNLSFDYKDVFKKFFDELAIQKGKDIKATGFVGVDDAKKYIETTHQNFKDQ